MKRLLTYPAALRAIAASAFQEGGRSAPDFIRILAERDNLFAMFIGHFGVALAAKRITPRASLGLLVFAAEFLDFLLPIFLLLGLEHVRVVPGITKVQPFDFYDYPFSHSLTMVLRWALAVGLIYFLARRYVRGAWVLAALVVSHWALDYVSHRPDLPLWPGGPKVGLGLWNSWPGSISVEALIFGVGIWFYLRATRPRDRMGAWAIWSLIALLSLGWLAALFAPPPTDTHQLAIGALMIWITIPWAAWADAHRDPVDTF